ncbi:MAG: hypothetical protein HY656_02270 [Acidobacteria bacterium]|nr:hypothetical protein [Acidobacteriota bacterium]
MTLEKTWDTIRNSLDLFDLPPYLVKVVRWVERHPRTVLAGAVVVLMAVALTQSPAEQPVESDPYADHTPLFI